MAKKEKRDLTGFDEDFTEKDMGFFYHIYLNKMSKFYKTFGEIIVCTEGENSLNWRRSIFSEYKRNRDKNKEDPSYIVMKKEISNVEKLLSFFPGKVISAKGAEADDSIFALSTMFDKNGEEVVIISTDGDFKQICSYTNNVKIYNPIKGGYQQPEDASNIIEYKSIVGDRSDNIPGLYRVGEAKFSKIIAEGINGPLMLKELSKDNNRELYSKFKEIVDLRRCPIEIHKKVYEDYESKPVNLFDPASIENFFHENKLLSHIERWTQDSSDIIETLTKNGVKYKGYLNTTNVQKETETSTEVDDILNQYL